MEPLTSTIKCKSENNLVKNYRRTECLTVPLSWLREPFYKALLERIHPPLAKSACSHVKQGENKTVLKEFTALFTKSIYSIVYHQQERVPRLIVVYLLGMCHSVEDSDAQDQFIEGERQVSCLSHWRFVKKGPSCLTV